MGGELSGVTSRTPVHSAGAQKKCSLSSCWGLMVQRLLWGGGREVESRFAKLAVPPLTGSLEIPSILRLPSGLTVDLGIGLTVMV